MFEKFILDFERKMVVVQKDKILLLVDNFIGHQVPIVGAQSKMTRLKFLPPNTISRCQLIDVRIIPLFKVQYYKKLISYQIDPLIENKIKNIGVD